MKKEIIVCIIIVIAIIVGNIVTQNYTVKSNVMLSNEDEESPLAKVASIIGDVFDVVNSEKKDELFDAGNPTETITTRISRTDVWDALSEFAIPHIHYSCEEIFAGKVGLLNMLSLMQLY